MTLAALQTSAGPPAPDRSAAQDERELLLSPRDDASLDHELLSLVLEPPRWLGPAIGLTATASLVLLLSVAYTVTTGIGVWGNDIPVAWAFGITNFVWWIGIGHAGTFISAFLLLFEQKWRASVNRFAEGMTLFALVQAGLFPILHLGRPWFFYWLFPYPSTLGVWPQFRSSLTWDVVAVSTYLTVSILFFYLGLIPDLATLRDFAKERWRRRVYGLFALGWYGSAASWRRRRVAYGLLAALAAPLVVSVHSIVSMDFAIGVLPGWHSTIFPPYFVAGAIYSGFAMVLTLMLPARRLYRLGHVITPAHLDKMAKMLLVTGLIVTYAYVVEAYSAWVDGDVFERHLLLDVRAHGAMAKLFWTVIACNCGPPLLLWSGRLRRHAPTLFALSLVIQLGMWLERLMLIVSSESADFLPASAHGFRPSLVDAALLGGSLAFFLCLFLLFLRFVPFIPLGELKALGRELREGA